MDSAKVKELKIFAAKVRIGILDAIHGIGSGHLGGALSIADVMSVLYNYEMKNLDPADPKRPDRDKLVISKGHCGPAAYATLALKGYFPYEELVTMNRGGTRLPSHCDRNKTPGIDMTTGSLGQGCSLAVGMALGDKLKGHDNRVFLIVGDGESDEGQVWEALAFASAKKLGNLVVLLDWNKMQLDGPTDKILPMGDYVKKFEAWGLKTQKVNGGDVEALAAALEKTREGGDQPYAIIMDTVKGAGIAEVAAMSNNHSVAVNDDMYERWTAELRAEIAELEG